MAVAVVMAFAAIAPAMASADVSSVATATYGPSGATGQPTPGTPTDYLIRQDFTYDTPATEDLKKWIVDSPAGLAGNPNAIPQADRCTSAQFDPSGTFGTGAGDVSQYFQTACPASSKVGEAVLYVSTDAISGVVPANTPLTPILGEIYILKTDPEVPTTLATRLTSTIYQAAVCATLPGAPAAPCNVYPRTKSILAPVTSGADGDFRIRTIPADNVSKPVAYGPTGSGFAAGPTPGHITRIDQRLYGNAANGNPFLAFPTRSSVWDSYSYSTAYNSNTTATLPMDPNNPGQLYSKSAASSTTPTDAKPALTATTTASISTGVRGSNPTVNVTLNNPNVPGNDVPKDVVVTLPGSLAVDIDAIGVGQVCSTADRDAETCPAASKVGTVKVETPFISAGLSGDVYITKGAQAGLPDLAIFVNGAIKFRLDGINHYTGSTGNQIQTTLTNLPQTPFSKFALTISGGASNSLLNVRTCSTTTQASPEDGPITASITGYTNQTRSDSNALVFDGCYGTPKVKSIKKCVKSKLAVNPSNLLNIGDISKVSLETSKYKNKKFRSLKTDKTSPFKFSVKLSKKSYKKSHKYYFRARTVYKPTVDAPKGKILYSKASTFKTCK